MQGIVTIIADMIKLLASFLGQTIKAHWGKMIFCLFCALIFFVLIFPYGDLTSLVSRQIYEQTGVSTRIGNLGLSMNPTPGLSISDLEINVAAPPLTIGAARVFPSLLSSLMSGGPFFTAEFDKIFGGDIVVSREPGDKVAEAEHSKEDIDLELTNVNLEQVIAALGNLTVTKPVQLPFRVSGSLSLESQLSLDPKFVEQPNAEILMTGKSIVFPPQSVPTQMGPLSFPKIQWSEIRIKGRMVGGEIIIEEAQLGKAGDPMTLKLKGSMALAIKNTRRGVLPQPGAYELDIDLVMAQSVDSVVGLLLTPIAGNYKSAVNNGSRYLFRANATRFGVIPKTRSIRPF